jgi:hypothetical protein
MAQKVPLSHLELDAKQLTHQRSGELSCLQENATLVLSAFPMFVASLVLQSGSYIHTYIHIYIHTYIHTYIYIYNLDKKVPCFSYLMQAAARCLCQTLLFLPKGSELDDKALQNLRKRPSFLAQLSPVFVPSLSWQIDHLQH